ncbi:MAG: UDP-glucose/GDP-mannose dehydrogenase family protein [Candidatus Diapherotrites archaeon]|nr:UDP-glucose/GDP-mannose dehydrogenase family protein [Candidatus Diapherotrites archaeon]
MKIAVLGTGYVGLVAGACFADLGNTVICGDIDSKKIELLNAGHCPIYEPGLEEIIERNVQAKRLSFTTDVGKAVQNSEIIFIAVGTPQDQDGTPDLKYVKSVAETIGKNMTNEKIIINKSTVPVGTGDLVSEIISKYYKGKFHVVSNPEFLREGNAIKDFMEPDRVVIGADSESIKKTLGDLYAPLNAEILFTDVKTAEMIKYASNAFLAVKISFINEVANLCDAVNADVRLVAEGMGLDARIGKAFLKAGCGWGGSCFPKDVIGLISIGNQAHVNLSVAQAAYHSNDLQKKLPVEKLKKVLGNLKGKQVGLLGLAFKPDTDDMRDAPSLVIMDLLKKEGAEIKAFDPVAMENSKKLFSETEYVSSVYDVFKNMDAVILVTEWNEFKELDFVKAKSLMKNSVLIDARNLYNPQKMRNLGFTYVGLGSK